MISGEEVRNLFPDTVPASLHRQVRAGSRTAQGALPAPGQQKVPAVRATLAQKGKCPRTSLHSLPNRRRGPRTAKAPPRNGVYWPRRREKQAARLAPQEVWLWQWQGGEAPLTQRNRKVILCFQYETFHTIKSNPKDFLDSVLTHF